MVPGVGPIEEIICSGNGSQFYEDDSLKQFNFVHTQCQKCLPSAKAKINILD